MPTPHGGESQSKWMHRCVPRLIDEGKPQDQAVAICLHMWRDRGKSNGELEHKSWALVLQALIAAGIGIAGVYGVEAIGDLIERGVLLSDKMVEKVLGYFRGAENELKILIDEKQKEVAGVEKAAAELEAELGDLQHQLADVQHAQGELENEPTVEQTPLGKSRGAHLIYR